MHIILITLYAGVKCLVNKQELNWAAAFCFDTCLHIGAHFFNGSGAITECGDASANLFYLDDLLLLARSRVEAALQRMKQVSPLLSLGFTIKWTISCPLPFSAFNLSRGGSEPN